MYEVQYMLVGVMRSIAPLTVLSEELNHNG